MAEAPLHLANSPSQEGRFAMSEVVCSGMGDTDGGHCCWVSGEVCEVLIMVDGIPRCPFIAKGEKMLGNPAWEKLPIADWFRRVHPTFDCDDYPQNMPKDKIGGLCCWTGKL